MACIDETYIAGETGASVGAEKPILRSVKSRGRRGPKRYFTGNRPSPIPGIKGMITPKTNRQPSTLPTTPTAKAQFPLGACYQPAFNHAIGINDSARTRAARPGYSLRRRPYVP